MTRARLFSRARARVPSKSAVQQCLVAGRAPWAALAAAARARTADATALAQTLPALARRAMAAEGAERSLALDSVGALALRQRLLGALDATFCRSWIEQLARDNVLKAIRVWKAGRAAHTDTQWLALGARLYLAASNPATARALAEQLAAPPADVVRALFVHSVQSKDLVRARAWLRRWPAPSALDMQWALSVAAKHDLAGALGLDGAPLAAAEPPQLSAGLLSYVRRVNTLLCALDLLNDTSVHKHWRTAMARPSTASLDVLVQSAAAAAVRHVARDDGAWAAVLRSCSPEAARAVLATLPLDARACAVVLARTPAADLDAVLAALRPEQLYSPACLTALATRSCMRFAELALPPAALPFAYDAEHLRNLWRAVERGWPAPPWLLAPTLALLRTQRLLRAVLRALLRQNDIPRIMLSLYYYLVVHAQPLDARFVASLAGNAPKLASTPAPDAREPLRVLESTLDGVRTLISQMKLENSPHNAAQQDDARPAGPAAQMAPPDVTHLGLSKSEKSTS